MTVRKKERNLLPGVNFARITPPIVPPHLLVRDSLMKELETSIPFAIFVVAPSGYGKTTLASQWAARNPDNTIWYTVSKSDTPKLSLFHFIESFRNLFPNFAPWAESFINIEIDQREVVTRMANEIGQLDRPINFITDSAENLSDDHREMMEYWTANAPLNIRTITTRTSVPAPIYARAATLNSIKVINAADLRLTTEEIENLADYYDVNLNLGSNKKAVNMAQGWPSGVNIALKALKAGKNISDGASFSDVKAMDSRTLVRTAINSLSEAERNFLYQMSMFEEVKPDSVRKMMNDSSARNTLRRMSAEGVFISEVGVDQSVFQINPIILDVISEDLQRDKERHKNISLQTANILLEEGNELSAIELFMEAGESEKAREIINVSTRKMIYTNNGDVLQRWRKVVAESLGLEFAGEALVDAYNAMISPALESCKSRYNELIFKVQGTNDFKKIEGDLSVMQLRILFSEGNLSDCITLALKLESFEYVQGEFSAAKILTGLRFASWAATLLEDMESLLQIQEIAERLKYPRDQVPLIGLTAIQAAVAVGEGRIKDARDLAIYTLNTSREYGYSGVLSPFDVTYALAEIAREYGENEEALERIDSILDLAQQYELHPWVAALQSKKALIQCDGGQSGEALRTLREVRQYLSSPYIGHEAHRIVDEHELFIRADVGDGERLQELLFRIPKTTTVAAFLAGVMIHKSQSRNISMISTLPQRTLREKLNFEILATQILIDRPNEARQHIHSAIHLAMSQGHRRIFLAQRTDFKNLILDYANSHPSIYMEQLAAAIRENLSNRNMNPGVALENPLTKRELDILRRLTTGLPISEIAASLHISNNTIKTHLKNVYKKLEVDSRSAAVTKGKELLLF